MTKKLSRTQVINLLSKHQTKQLPDTTVDYPDSDKNSMVWHNEYSARGSLRVSKSGLWELKCCFKIYPIPMKPGFQVKNVHVKCLEDELVFPYYLDNKMLVLFSGKDALEIKLQDGDLDTWARARWINQRYQEPPKLPEDS
tara:strand:+ start:2958 stop:3380 length:423 start_codon:yes stop_codon:yes gene_type:complete